MNLESHTAEQLHEQTITPPIVESFSQSQIKKIQDRLPLTTEQIIKCENHLNAIDQSSGGPQKEHIKELLGTLIQIITKDEVNLLPTILKNIRKESANILITYPDSNSYINLLLGRSKTENIIADQNKGLDEQITNKQVEKQTLTPEEYEQEKKLDEQEKKLDEQEKKLDEQYKKLNKIYDDNSNEIKNQRPKDLNKYTIIDKIPSEKIKIFRKAFGYVFENKPGEPIWANGQENDDVDNKIAKLIYYHAQLNDKIVQSKKNPKIKVTPKEQLQAQEFTNTLTSFGINQEEFYTSLDIQYKEAIEGQSNNNNKNRSYEFTTNEPSVSKESFTTTKESTLDNLSGNFDKMNSGAMKVDPIFKDQFSKTKSGFDDKSLLQSFPLPKGKSMLDFDIKNPKLMGVIFSTLKDEKSHPLISSSTPNPEKILRAKKALIVRTLFEANPNLKELPLSIASKLYPPQPGKEQKIPSRRRKENIEKELLIPLMYNNFCNTTQEQFITQEIKKGYMDYFNRLLIATPALKDFEFKPEEIVLSNNQVKLPLYLKGEKQVNSNLLVEDGQIYITNSLYNPLNTDPNTISKGRMYIGTINDFKKFSEQVTSSIRPDIIKESVSDTNPRTTYNNKIQQVIDRTIDANNEELYNIQAGIAHGLAGAKAQSSIFNLMQHRHKDGETQIQDDTSVEASNPFYNILNNYITDSSKNISKQDNVYGFEGLYLSKNAVLQNSATENEVLSRDINRLQTLLTDKTFNLKISNYLKNKPTNEGEQYKYNILQTLQADNRKQGESFALLLKLFGTHPERGKENINSINIDKFHNFITQLDHINDLSLLNIDSLINTNNPVFASLDKQYTISADDELLTDLDSISDDEKIETIIT